jgi:hypothetical protein
MTQWDFVRCICGLNITKKADALNAQWKMVLMLALDGYIIADGNAGKRQKTF